MKAMNLKKLILCGALFLSAIPAFATKEAGNGGDLCEDRFNSVRDDIKSWILKGGAADLNLPVGISLDAYKKGMLDEIARAQVSCTDATVMIGKAEKSCKNFVDSSGTPRILCNTTRLMKDTSESGQYILAHHEYAGLSGFEVNDGEESHYSISNQITADLEDQVVKKLVVRAKKTDSFCAQITDPGIQKATATLALLELNVIDRDLQKKGIEPIASSLSTCFPAQIDYEGAEIPGGGTDVYPSGLRVSFLTKAGSSLVIFNEMNPLQTKAVFDNEGNVTGYEFRAEGLDITYVTNAASGVNVLNYLKTKEDGGIGPVTALSVPDTDLLQVPVPAPAEMETFKSELINIGAMVQ